MDFNDERRILEKRLKDEWGELTQIAYENVNFELASNNAADAEWIQISIRPGAGSQHTLGPNPSYRYVGVAFVQIFVPKKSGTSRGRELAERVAEIFRGYAAEGLVCRAPYMDVVGPTEGWFQINVLVPYVWTT